MTVEEKAKAYDSAINQAKKELQTCGSLNCDAAKQIFRLFPELAESEDKRIRKYLIEELKAAKSVGELKFIIPQPTREECIAYLEKQKDASKAIEAVDRIDKYIDEHLANAHDMKDSNPDKKYYRGWDDALGKMSGILQDVYSDEKQKELENISASTVFPSCWAEEPSLQKEQKARRMERYQELVFKDICKHLEVEGYSGWVVFLNALRNGEFQPNQEWSEEDEDVFNDILLDMGDRREMFKSKGETTFAENTQKKIDWLNSHHLQLKYSYCPQPEQEWSDRDKEMLEFVLGLLDNLVWRRDWEISKAECLEWLVKSLNPTKKEWSEDDEKMRINILNALTPQLVYSSGKGTYTGTSTYKYDDEIKWLKSLRPSWKPSEDEERLINTSISFLKDFADKGYENAVECIDWLKSKLNGNSGK